MGNTPLQDLAEQIGAARGLKADREWADAALWRLVVATAPTQYSQLLMEQALAAVTTAHAAESNAEAESDTEHPEGNPPQSLHSLLGDPRDYISQGLDELAAAGTPFEPDDDSYTWLAPITTWAGLTSFAFLAITISLSMSRGDRIDAAWTHLVVMPVVMAITVGAVCGYGPATRRLGFIPGAALTVVTTAATIAAAAYSFSLIDEPRIWINTAWGLVPAAFFAILTVLLLRHGFSDPTDSTPIPAKIPAAPATTKEWLSAYEQALRVTGVHTDRAIRRMTREASEHLADSGTSGLEEFGPPEAYAKAMPPGRGVKELRMAVLYLVASTLFAGSLTYGLITGERPWIQLIAFLLITLTRTIPACAAYLRSRKQSPPEVFA